MGQILSKILFLGNNYKKKKKKFFFFGKKKKKKKKKKKNLLDIFWSVQNNPLRKIKTQLLLMNHILLHLATTVPSFFVSIKLKTLNSLHKLRN